MCERPRILLAHEDELEIDLWRDYLADLDCEIDVSNDGHDTLQRAKQSPPNLIVLNPTIPKVSGFVICEEIKTRLDAKRIMIMMITKSNELDMIDRAVAARVDDFLSTPVSQSEFIKRVENLLKLSRL